METKPINCTKEVYKDFMIRKVLPAARRVWPREDCDANGIISIKFQHDNAKAHFEEDDVDWMRATTKHRKHYKIMLQEQPSNSYDTNALDLGFFVSLQADTWKLKRADNIDGLIANVKAAWNAYDPGKLNRVFLTHACCCDQIIRYYGSNNYKIPHMKKQHLERNGQLPRWVRVSQAAKEQLEAQNNH